MTIMTKWHCYAAAGALTLIASTQASANIISAVTATTDWFIRSPGLLVIPGTTSSSFTLPQGARFGVTFSSECSVNAPAGNGGSWTDVDIVVLNTAGAVVATLAPTVGSSDAFCSSNGTAAFDGWEFNSVTAVGGPNLPPGTYRVQVRARLNNGATDGQFGERSLVVFR